MRIVSEFVLQHWATMSITGTAAQGQHPCWDVKESYCLTDCVSTLIHVICVSLGSWCCSLAAADLSEKSYATLLLSSEDRSNVTRPRFYLCYWLCSSLKNKVYLLVGKLLKLKALTCTAICISCWRIILGSEEGKERCTSQGNDRTQEHG